MKMGKLQPTVVVMLSTLLMMACMLPGMISRDSESEGPMPYMEEDPKELLETLRGGGVNSLESLAPERYTEEDLAKPGTWTYTVTISDDTPTYFSYGWCAVDEDTLRQNFELMDVKLYFNDEQLGNDVVHTLTYTSPADMPCLAVSALMSQWPTGEYELKAVATFDETVNDGLGDYPTGDYIFIYNVVVK